MTKVRLLVDQSIDGVWVPANGVVNISDDLIEDMVAHGIADTDAEAVAFADTLAVPIPPELVQLPPDPPPEGGARGRDKGHDETHEAAPKARR